MITMMVMTTTMRMTTTMTTMTTRVTQHWDLIEARGFHKDTKDIRNNNVDDGEDVEDNDNNDEKNNTIPYQTKPNNTKINITQSFLKLQALDFAWSHIWTKGTHQMMRIDTKPYQNITKPNHTIPSNTKIGITRTFLKLQAPEFAW